MLPLKSAVCPRTTSGDLRPSGGLNKWINQAILARFLADIMAITRDQELDLLHVDAGPFTFNASLPHLEQSGP